MALRGVVATQGGLIRPSTWGKIKFGTQFLAIFLAFFRLADRWGPWYLDQWVMLIAVIATVGSAWGYISAFWHTVRTGADPDPHVRVGITGGSGVVGRGPSSVVWSRKGHRGRRSRSNSGVSCGSEGSRSDAGRGRRARRSRSSGAGRGEGLGVPCRRGQRVCSPDPDRMDLVNIEGTRNVMEACRARRGREDDPHLFRCRHR